MGTRTQNSARKKDVPSNGIVGSMLIVDDSAVWRKRVREILREQPKLRIAEACDGFQAVRLSAQLHPDLVLLDIGMPVMNGLDAAEHIKRVSPRSKIVFLTQESDTEILGEALAAGAHGYVLKVSAGSELLSTIGTVLQNGDQTL